MIVLQAFDLFMKTISQHISTLPQNPKSSIIAIAKALRSNSLIVLEFVKKELQAEKKEIGLKYFLIGLNFLAINKSFPY